MSKPNSATSPPDRGRPSKDVHDLARRKGSFRGARLLAAMLLVCAASVAAGQEDLDVLEEMSVKAAADRIAPHVVNIETIGGAQNSALDANAIPVTTGLIVSADGYIVTSAAMVSPESASIIVRLADGTRFPAEIVARDHSRMLTLLRVKSTMPLPVPEGTSAMDVRVGMWAIAVGKGIGADSVNVSVGIVSASNRMWGKALQTDAKISPANYGGPLLDIQGRVLGVLVPMSPQEESMDGGTDWYDSGIGFAVPYSQVMTSVEKLKAGKDLYKGRLGIILRRTDDYVDPPVIQECRPKSPAAKAGIQPGDKIIAVEGVPVERTVHLLRQLNPRYAGESVQFKLLRGDMEVDVQIELVDKIEPFERPFLGILPERVVKQQPLPDDKTAEAPLGVRVRYVFEKSGAQAAGVQPGDVIVAANAKPVASAADLSAALMTIEAGGEIELQIRRQDMQITSLVRLTGQSSDIPLDLPMAENGVADPSAGSAQVGTFPWKSPEFKNESVVFVPEKYDPRVPHGILMYLPSGTGPVDAEFVQRFTADCEKNHLILLVPKSVDPRRIERDDLEFAKKLLDNVISQYTVDAQRVVVMGEGRSGTAAMTAALAWQGVVRGAVICNAVPRRAVPSMDASLDFRILLALAEQSRISSSVESAARALQKLKMPVTLLRWPGKGVDLPSGEIPRIFRWIDTLDRI